MKKILVTGHKGFLGSALVKNLRKNPDNEVITLDDINNNGFNIIYEGTKLPKVDWIYHMAGSTGGIGYITKNAQKVVLTNNILDKKILMHCYHGGAERLFYPSSACIYPEYRQNGKKDTLSEQHAWPALPDTMYGLEKLYMERMLEMVKDKFEVRIGRLFSVYGPEGPYMGDKAKFIPALIRKVIENKKTEDPVEIWGTGKAVRSLIYIEDAVNAINLVMENANNADPINIASCHYDVMDVFNFICYATKNERALDNVIMNKDKPTGVYNRIANIKKLQDLGFVSGWGDKLGFSVSLKLTYNWILEDMESKNGR